MKEKGFEQVDWPPQQGQSSYFEGLQLRNVSCGGARGNILNVINPRCGVTHV